MPRGIRSEVWTEENKTLFLRLCRAAYKPAVDWKKFRRFKAAKVFKDVPNTILSATYRKFRLIEEGLCWHCGKNIPEYTNGLCEGCFARIRHLYTKEKAA